jgi:hypothetical protein
MGIWPKKRKLRGKCVKINEMRKNNKNRLLLLHREMKMKKKVWEILQNEHESLHFWRTKKLKEKFEGEKFLCPLSP